MATKPLMQQAAEEVARQNVIVPITQDFDESKGVEGRVGRITSQDSPLMRQAATSGTQLAARRGLVNSSLAAQASQQAVIGAATPIATADASLYQQQGLANQNYRNSAATTNAQLGTNAGLTGLSLAAQAEQQAAQLAQQESQFGRSQSQQEHQFGITSGMTQQQIDAQRAQYAASLAEQQAQRAQQGQQFGVSSGQQQQQIDAQREQFAAQLGMTVQDMELKRATLTQQQQQFIAGLDQQKAQLAQQAQQFGATQEQQQAQFEAKQVQDRVLANMDATTRKELAAIEQQNKLAINADQNISGAWGTMMQSISAIQNNPNLDGPAKTASIANQLESFKSFTNFWQRMNASVDVGPLLNFGMAGELGAGGNTPAGYYTPPAGYASPPPAYPGGYYGGGYYGAPGGGDAGNGA